MTIEVSRILIETATSANSRAEVSRLIIELASEFVDSNSFIYSTISSNNVLYSNIALDEGATQKVSELYVEILSNAAAKYVYIFGSGWWYYTGNNWSLVSGSGGGGGGSWQIIDGEWVWIDEYGGQYYYYSLLQALSDLSVEVLSSNTTISAEPQHFLYM